MRKSGLRPTLSQYRPPEIALIADHTLRQALMRSCSVLFVTKFSNIQGVLFADLELVLTANGSKDFVEIV